MRANAGTFNWCTHTDNIYLYIYISIYILYICVCVELNIFDHICTILYITLSLSLYLYIYIYVCTTDQDTQHFSCPNHHTNLKESARSNKHDALIGGLGPPNSYGFGTLNFLNRQYRICHIYTPFNHHTLCIYIYRGISCIYLYIYIYL